MTLPLRLTFDCAVNLWRAPREQRVFGKMHFMRYSDWYRGDFPPFSLSLDNRDKKQIKDQYPARYYYGHSYAPVVSPPKAEGTFRNPEAEMQGMKGVENFWTSIPPLWQGLSGNMYNELSDNYPDRNYLLLGPVLWFDDEADAVQMKLLSEKFMTNEVFNPLTLARMIAYGVDN